MKNYHRRFRQTSSGSHPKKSNAQAIILAGLNVMQSLADNAPQYLQTVLHYGPDSFIGKDYACVLVWYRRKGYQNYRELTLSGVWAIDTKETTDLIIGSKVLLYNATVYNAESYHSVIKQTFMPYYGDDSNPPGNKAVVYRTSFDVSRRIALRRELSEQLILHLQNLSS